MRKSPFLIFAAIVGMLVTGTLLFIQSARFAEVLKTAAARYVPKDMGIEGDFSELAVRMFPPGVSIKSLKIKLGRHNIVDLPPRFDWNNGLARAVSATSSRPISRGSGAMSRTSGFRSTSTESRLPRA